MPCRTRASLLLAPALLAPAGCSGGSAAKDVSGGKHVILITIDTLRADHLGCYGYARATSPRMDALAAAGIRFDQAWVQWPKTTPSLASMLTGMYPHSTGVVRSGGLNVADRFELLAERMKRAGYATVGVVTNPNLGTEFGFGQGFDAYLQMWETVAAADAPKIEGPDSTARKVGKIALDAVDDLAGTAPLFLWVHYTEPHTPYTPPPQYADRFVGDARYDASRTAPFVVPDPSLPEPMDDGFGGIPGHARLGDDQRVDWYVAQYDAEIYTCDEQIGQLLDGLKERGYLDSALVALTSDHGEHLGEHDLYFMHGPTAYEGTARVPFLLSAPGLPRGATIATPVGMIDLQPTILEWAGIPFTEGLEGRSLLPLLLEDETLARPVYLGAGYLRAYQRAIRHKNWKLVHVPEERDRERMKGSEYELYDLDADPGETRNVFDDPAHKQVAEFLVRRLQIWAEEGEKKGVPDAAKVDATSDAMRAELRALGYAR